MKVPLIRPVLAAVFFAVLLPIQPAAVAQGSMEEDVAQALALFNSGNYADAATAYEALIGKYAVSPIAAEARFRLAYINFLQGDYDKAIGYLEQLAKPPEPSPEVRQLADVLWPQILAAKGAAMAQGKPEREATLKQAIERFDAFIKTYPKSEEVESALYGRSVAEVQLGDFAAAETTLRGLLKAFPRSESVLDTQYLVGIVFAAEAGKLVEENDGKATPEALAKLGQAEQVLNDIATKRTDVALANDAQFQRAEILFSKAIYSPEADKAALYAKALEAYRNVEPKERMIQAQEERSANILARMREAGRAGDTATLKRLQRLQEKEQGKLAVLKEKPDQTVEAAIKQGQIYFQLGKLDEARVLLRYVQPLAEDAEQQKKILYFITLSYGSQKVADKAVESYNAFKEKYPKDPMADNLPVVIGAIFLDPAHNDPEKAVEYFDEALEDYPEGRYSAEAVTQKASALLRLKAYDEAAETFRAFLKTNPRKELAAAADFGLATVLKDTGKQGEAIKSFGEIVAKYPDTPQAEQATFWVGQLRKDTGDLPGAIAGLKTFLGKYPESSLVPPALLALGQAQAQANETDNAIATYRKLAEKYPDSDPAPFAYFSLAQIYGSAGQTDEMVGAMKQFIEKYPSHALVFSAYDTIGQSLLAQQDVEGAVANYEQMVESNPDNPQSALALQKIAEILYAYAEAQGRYIALNEEQRAVWQKAVDGSIASAERLLDNYPDSPAIALALQTLLADQRFLVAADQKKTEDIETYFRGLADKFKDKPATRSKILFGLASYLYSTDPEKAVSLMDEAYDPAQKYAPSDIDLYAEALLDAGKVDEAKAVATKLAADYTAGGDPTQAPREVQEAQAIALYLLSQVAQKQGQVEEAAKLSDQLKKLYPWSPKIAEANYLIAQSMIPKGEFDGALDLLIPTIRSTTASAELRAEAMLLGGKIQQAKYEALKKQGKTADSRKALEAAIDYFLKISVFYQGVPKAAAEGLWLGGQLLEVQAGTR